MSNIKDKRTRKREGGEKGTAECVSLWCVFCSTLHTLSLHELSVHLRMSKLIQYNQDRIVCMSMCVCFVKIITRTKCCWVSYICSLPQYGLYAPLMWSQQTGTDQTKPNHTKPDQEKQHTARQLPPTNSDQHAWVRQSNQSSHLGERSSFPGRATAHSRKQLSAPGSRQWC